MLTSSESQEAKHDVAKQAAEKQDEGHGFSRAVRHGT
jgi:hypothetical protein